ncbi:MAG TPA: DUF5018 domain-containing protein [Spirochaetota bacterium]|nr:DUF5018 domain-containing protein [Spirochaetota bacterium]HPV42993.1 DUF5018 domain-containing protein [Spirochaetota bacterium]
MKRVSVFILMLLTVVFITACGEGKKNDLATLFMLYPRFGKTFSMVQYNFPASKNPSLSGDAIGSINDSAITVNVPHDADVANLIAEFTPSSEKITVKVNGVVQKSDVTSNNYTNPVALTMVYNNKDVLTYTITVIRAKSDEKSMLTFTLNGIDGVIDDTSGAITVDLPPRTDLTSLIASFSTSGISVLSGGVDQISGVTANDFTNPVAYTVTAEDGSTKQYTVTARVLPSSRKEITSFSFLKANNDALPADVNGTISGTKISVELPFGSSRDNLKATFETSGEGETVAIGETAQVSGETVNAFTTPITYRVTAEDKTTADYEVTVTVAKNDAKAITSFILDGETCAIDQDKGAITVDFPSTKIMTGLVAKFVSTGVSVQVNDVDQVSGTTANDFSNPVTYTVVAENNTKKTYTVTVTGKTDIAGLWNFESPSDGSYTISGTTTATGLSGSALQFNGTSDYVSVPDSDTFTLGEAGTVEAVVYMNAYTRFAGIVHKGTRTDFNDESYSLQFWDPDGILRFSIFNDAGAYLYVDSPDILETGKWYHLAGTWDQSRIVLYLDGVEVASATNTVGAVRNTNGDLIIGAQLPVQYNGSWHNLGFSGIIDRVRIYNRALTAEEISAGYSAIFAPGGQPLTAYLLSAVSKRGMVLGVILGVVAAVLLGMFVRNRRLSLKTRR